MDHRYYQRKTKNIFLQFVGIGLGFATLFAIFGFNLYPKLLLVWQSFLGRLQADCGCTHHLSFANHPYLFSSLILVGIGILSGLTLLTISFAKTRKTTRRFIRASLENKKIVLSQKLKKIARAIDLEGRVIETKSPEIFIFCFNFFKPKICVSDSLVRKLSENELTAVLLHEQYHLFAYDPIKLFFIKVLSKVLFFVPSLKLLFKQYSTLSELAADEYATNSFQNKAPLAAALSKMIGWQEQLILQNKAAVPFFGIVLDERINQLTSDNYASRIRIFTPKLIFNLVFIFLFFFFSNIILYSKTFAFTDPANLSCSSEEPEINQCDMVKEDICEMVDFSEEHSCQGME